MNFLWKSEQCFALSFTKHHTIMVIWHYVGVLIVVITVTATDVLACCPGPEIDPFWYVGRGVRPIGRFGKRHSSVESLGSEGMQPMVRTLALLLNSIRNKENLGNMDAEDRDWLP